MEYHSSSTYTWTLRLSDFLFQEGLCIFNDGTDTYLHPGNGSYSAIDIYVTDPSLLLDFSWNINTFYWHSSNYAIFCYVYCLRQNRKLNI